MITTVGVDLAKEVIVLCAGDGQGVAYFSSLPHIQHHRHICSPVLFDFWTRY
jgi:hypothetical protein